MNQTQEKIIAEELTVQDMESFEKAFKRSLDKANGDDRATEISTQPSLAEAISKTMENQEKLPNKKCSRNSVLPSSKVSLLHPSHSTQ